MPVFLHYRQELNVSSHEHTLHHGGTEFHFCFEDEILEWQKGEKMMTWNDENDLQFCLNVTFKRGKITKILIWPIIILSTLISWAVWTAVTPIEIYNGSFFLAWCSFQRLGQDLDKLLEQCLIVYAINTLVLCLSTAW